MTAFWDMGRVVSLKHTDVQLKRRSTYTTLRGSISQKAVISIIKTRLCVVRCKLYILAKVNILGCWLVDFNSAAKHRGKIYPATRDAGAWVERW
jgi:hypothetical protein